jgi:oxygen-independent coproporphyrinogen-3 oxidase
MPRMQQPACHTRREPSGPPARHLMESLDMLNPEIVAQLATLASRGPRYTSYPPATEFFPIDADRVQQELERVGDRGEPISLYVHIPFCRSLCWYCGCNVIPSRDASRGVAYLDRLAIEIDRVGTAVRSAPVTEIALGGGSPNFLSPQSLHHLFTLLDQSFAIAGDARRSIELDPRNTTSAQIDALAAARFTSLSMGVQDFSEAVQDAIHRHQSVRQTRWLVDRARGAGFDDINVDVVYGLPHQTEPSFTRTLEAVIDLAPDRIALFGYAHLPSKLPHQQLVERRGRVLDGKERAALLVLAIDRLTAAGYLHLGLDHFARPGSRLARAAADHRMARSFQGYVEHLADAVLGLGVSAISSTPRMHWQNHAELADWESDVAAGRLPVARGIGLDDDDRIRRAVIGRLMCNGEVDLGRIGVEHGVDDRAYFAAELAALRGLADLACYDGDARTIRATELGRLLIRNVCMVFDRYHRGAGGAGADGRPRFSPTI